MKCVYIRNFFGPYFPVFGLNTAKYRAGKTPYSGNFYAVAVIDMFTVKNKVIITADIYLLKDNNINTITKYEICSKLTIKTPERHQWRRSGVFIVNFQNISHHVLVFLLLTLSMLLPSEQVSDS